jgi:broad specificity phosphatase PhoE
VTLYLVRHAKAGSRKDWEGADRDRPLSGKGRRQAEGLVDLLADRPVRRVLSSPYLRCVQTVEPLAEKLGLPVEKVDALAEEADPAEAVELLRGLAGTTAALCTHGDLIPPILDTLAAADGLPLPPGYPFAKGSVWELDVLNGRWLAARYLPAAP